MPEDTHILDTVMDSEQTAALRMFNPQELVLERLEKLEEREKDVLLARYGLLDGAPQTLEHIGHRLHLTRERIRQIEKDSLRKLESAPPSPQFEKGVDLIYQVIEDHGNAARENHLLGILLPVSNLQSRQAVIFILNLAARFNLLEENPEFHQTWFLDTFDKEQAGQIVASAAKILQEEKAPLNSPALFQKIRSSSLGEGWDKSDKALESILLVSKKIDKNPYGEWGLQASPEITPKDVGDKAYLVLKHHGKPEHYGKITEMINKQGFDSREAHKETVHNELIKDDRFVLVGRGIYALKEWGYKKGIVSEIIQDILNKAARPLSKNEIIDEVLKQRLVKRNTVVVGLSNKKLFKKTPDNKYLNAS